MNRQFAVKAWKSSGECNSCTHADAVIVTTHGVHIRHILSRIRKHQLNSESSKEQSLMVMGELHENIYKCFWLVCSHS